MASLVQSSLSPFFDRLCGIELDLSNGINLDALGFQNSLLLDLTRLFNSRCDLSIEEYLESEKFIFNFGIPALSVFSPQAKSDHIKLEQLLSHAIKLYEPRMTQVKVMVSSESNDHRSVKVEILSAVIFGERMLRFAPSFHLNPTEVEVVVKPEFD